MEQVDCVSVRGAEAEVTERHRPADTEVNKKKAKS